MDGFTINTLKGKKDEIKKLLERVSFAYLRNGVLRSQYIREEMDYSDTLLSGVITGKFSYHYATLKLKEQLDMLKEKEFELLTEQVKIYAIAQLEKENKARNRVNIILKNVGFVGGALQVYGGGGLCVASLGTACASLGVPLAAHGAENVYKNVYYLILRKNPQTTPLRDAYKQMALLMGGSEKHGDIAYSVGDISLSLATGFKSNLKPDTWKLYRYIKKDFIMGWKSMGTVGVASETVSNSASAYTIYELMNNNRSSDWSNLADENN